MCPAAKNMNTRIAADRHGGLGAAQPGSAVKDPVVLGAALLVSGERALAGSFPAGGR